MILEVKDPIAALNCIFEELLLSYRYDAQGEVFVIVLDYNAGKAWGADRAFLRLRFEGVSNFQRLKGEYPGLQKFTDSYSIRETRVSPVVENMNVDVQVKYIRIRFWFDSGFGGVLFECERVTAEARNTRAIKTGPDEWYYYDFSDGAEVDFQDPFA